MHAPKTYRNPILPGMNPDPSITHVPGKGYYLCTSTFEFFPGLPIYHSPDMVHWTLIGHALNRRSQGVDMRTVEASGGLWAPTLRYNVKRGRWYVACTCFYKIVTEGDKPYMVEPTGFYVSTDDIHDDSKWSDAVYFEELGFDQDILFDDDDRTYLTCTRFHMTYEPEFSMKIVSYSNEFDLSTGRSLSPPRLTMDSVLGTAEGCHIIKREGWYYLFTAEGGTQDGHQEWVYRSDKPLGPWVAPPDHINPIVFNGNHPHIQNTGHLDMVEGENGQWWAVFLGVRPQFRADQLVNPILMRSALGRESFMAPVEWVDGWPVVNGQRPIELVGEANVGSVSYVPATNWIDEFKTTTLQLGWYRIRTPLRPFHSLTDRPGYLSIRGSAYPIDYQESPSALLRKQPDFEGEWSTEMDFLPRVGGWAAGLVVWLDKDAHITLSVRGTGKASGGRGGSGRELVFKAPSADRSFQETTFELDSEAGPLVLGVKARKDAYELWYKRADDQDQHHDQDLAASSKRTVVGLVKTSLFQPLFTGVHIGVYAHGVAGSPCLEPAYFRYAKWEVATGTEA